MKNGRHIAYWITTIMGPASFVIGGTINLLQSDQALAMLAHLGYPAYFASILGTWKLLGAIVTVVPGMPRLKEWAYAGFVFNLTAASISHAALGDGIAAILTPLVSLAFVLASWALRPASRRLVAPWPAHRAAVRPTPFEPVPVNA